MLVKLLKVDPEIVIEKVNIPVEVIKEVEVPSGEVVIKFERKPLSRMQEDSLSRLKNGDLRGIKNALFQLIDNYKWDISESYLKEGNFKIGDILFKFDMLKSVIERAKSLEDKGIKRIIEN